MQRIRLSAARGGDQIWQSDVSLKSVSDGTERERRILRGGGGGGSVKRERCWVNWRSWKEEGMRRNEGRDRWNTGKTFPKMVRAPVRASLSKYERRERRKKKKKLSVPKLLRIFHCPPGPAEQTPICFCWLVLVWLRLPGHTDSCWLSRTQCRPPADLLLLLLLQRVHTHFFYTSKKKPQLHFSK